MVWAEGPGFVGDQLPENLDSLPVVSDGVADVGQIAADGQRVGVVWAEDPDSVGKQGVELFAGLLELACVHVCPGESVARRESVRMVGAEGAIDVADEALEQVDRLLSASRLKIGFGKVAACAERAGVVGAEDSSLVGRKGFEDADGALEVSRLHVRFGEIGQRVEGVGVVGAESPEPLGKKGFVGVDGFHGFSCFSVGQGEVGAYGERVRMVGSIRADEFSDGVFKSDRDLRAVNHVEAIYRVVDESENAWEIDAGFAGRVERAPLVSFGDGVELDDHVENVGALGFVGGRLLHVGDLQHPDDGALDGVEQRRICRKVFSKGAPLKLMDADIAAVGGGRADREGDELLERFARNLFARACLIQPVPGHARRRQQGQSRQLQECRAGVGCRFVAAGAVLLSQMILHGLAGHEQGRGCKGGVAVGGPGNRLAVATAGRAVGGLIKPELPQVREVVVQPRVPDQPDRGCGLLQGDGQVPERFGHAGRAVGVVHAGVLNQESDRLGPRKPPRGVGAVLTARAGVLVALVRVKASFAAHVETPVAVCT